MGNDHSISTFFFALKFFGFNHRNCVSVAQSVMGGVKVKKHPRHGHASVPRQAIRCVKTLQARSGLCGVLSVMSEGMPLACGRIRHALQISLTNNNGDKVPLLCLISAQRHRRCNAL